MSEDFINRRGRRLGSDGEIIGSTVDTELLVTPKPSISKPRRRRRARRRVAVPWKLIGIVALVGVVALLVTFELARGSYISSVAHAKQQVTELTKTDVTAAMKQSSVKSSTLRSLSERFKAVSMSLCAGGLLDNYASLYPRAHQALGECTAYRSSVEALVVALDTMADDVGYLEQLQPIFTPVTQPLQDQFAVLTSQRDNWKAVVEQVQSLTPSTGFLVIHQAFIARTQDIANVWVDLVAASDVFDTTKFTEARSKLTVTYAAVRQSADELEQALSHTQTAVSRAAAQL